MQPVKKAVILAAGYGTRFLPFSKAVSKTMLPIVDKPAIQTVVEEALDAGMEQIVIVVGANGEAIKNHFSAFPELEERLKNNPEALQIVQSTSNMGVIFATQAIPNGTAGGILCAKDMIGNEPFLLMFADDVMFSQTESVSKQLVNAYLRTGKHIIGVQHVKKEEATKYGCVEFGAKNGRYHNVTGFTEKPKLEEVKSTLVSLGRFVMKPSYFEFLSSVAPGKNGELSAADALIDLLKSEELLAYEFEGIRYDTGDKFGYLRAVLEFSLRDPVLGPKMKTLIEQLAQSNEE